jgi:Flp pilus assembly CpaE family ATPase
MDSILSYNVFNTSGGDIVSKVRSQVVARTVDVLGEY